MPPTHRLRSPLFLLCLVSALLAFVVQSGDTGTADTAHRLQVTHWLWTSEPQVFPHEYPEFGIHGRGGKIYSWYGIGQSLLMLPADLIGTAIARLPIFREYEDDPSVRSIVVSYSTNILINVLTALIVFRFLRQLLFSQNESILGVLALLCCTTHLHYTQNMMENNYIMLLTLAGFSFQYEWWRTGSRRALAIGSGALGLNLLTRVTTGMDLIAAGVFLLVIFWLEKGRLPRTGLTNSLAKDMDIPAGAQAPGFFAAFGGTTEAVPFAKTIYATALSYLKVAVPIYAFFAVIERYYNYYRFGSWTGTYLPTFAKESLEHDPSLPANYPWSTPFHEGVLGALFKPEKSIFLFDPLLVLAIVLLVILWKRLSAELRAYAVTTLLLLAGYISFYAPYTFWAGDMAWGDRYVSTTVELAALLAVPLLVKYRASLGPWVWRAGIVLIVVSLAIQVASLAFWLPLEIYQMETLGHPTFVVALRFENIAAFALGKMQAWGLANEEMTYDPWDYVRITCWNFLPFVLRRVGEAPAWVVRIAFATWYAAMAALVWASLRLRHALSAHP